MAKAGAAPAPRATRRWESRSARARRAVSSWPDLTAQTGQKLRPESVVAVREVEVGIAGGRVGGEDGGHHFLRLGAMARLEEELGEHHRGRLRARTRGDRAAERFERCLLTLLPEK